MNFMNLSNIGAMSVIVIVITMSVNATCHKHNLYTNIHLEQ